MSLEFRCPSVGVTDCKAVTHAETEEELLELVAAHAREVHGVELNQTLINYALSTVEEK